MPNPSNPKIVRFDSLGTMLHYVATEPVKCTHRLASEQEESSYRSSWSGAATFTEAVNLAKLGWIDKANDIQSISAPIIDKLTSLIEKHSITYDVEGIGIDVARYLDGEPECWQKWESETVEGHGTKHIKILFNVGVSAGISTEVITAKGSAIVALIEALEYSGCRVQLTVTMSYGAWEFYTTIKSSDQPLDLPRVAYALAHPSMLRRIVFRLLECQPEWKSLDAGGCYSGNGNGYNWRTNPSEMKNSDVYVCESYLGQPQWTNTQSTEKWIMEELKKQGISIRKENE